MGVPPRSGALARVLAMLFAPGTTLLGRLRYAKKFAFIGLVLLLPLAYVTRAYVRVQDEQIAFSAKEIPVGRVGQPEDIAHLVSFFVSEGAGFVSGQVVYAAGGPKA